jgi:hypothetical protein
VPAKLASWPEDAVEFDRMADRFVNLQTKLASHRADSVPVFSGHCAAECSATDSRRRAGRGAVDPSDSINS